MHGDEESEGEEIDKTKKKKTSGKSTSGKSEYERKREENIARNKELLKATMAGSGYSDLINDLKMESAKKNTSKVVTNPKKAKTTKQAGGRSGGM